MQKKTASVVSLLFSLVSVMLILLPGCNPSGDSDADSDYCSTNSDCNGGEICRWERCLAFCVTASDCPSDKYCHGAGVCTECSLDANCPDGNFCVDGKCTPEDQIDYGKSCKSNIDCGEGQICYKKSECRLTCQADLDCEASYKRCNADGVCSECLEASDCLAGQTCENEKCVDKPGVDGDEDVDSGEAPESEEESATGPDGWPGDACGDELPQCRSGNVCYSLTEDETICTHECTSSAECIFDISGGCCLALDETSKYCSTSAYCDDIGLDGKPCTAAEACLEADLKCLKNASGTNFCSRKCNKDSDCPSGSYPDGCCRQIGENSWCVLNEFCK